MTIAETILREPWRFRLGPLITWLGRMEGTDDPLAGGDFDLAPVRIRHRMDRRPPVHDVDGIERTGDGRWNVITGSWNLIGTAGVLAYTVQSHFGALGPVSEGVDRLLHRLVASWYADWKDDGGWIAERPPSERSALGLALALQSRLGVPVRVEPCLLAWRISVDGETLGLTRQGQGRVIVGPVAAELVPSFLPGGVRMTDLSRWLQELSGEATAWRLCVIAPLAAFAEVTRNAPIQQPRPVTMGDGNMALEFPIET